MAALTAGLGAGPVRGLMTASPPPSDSLRVTLDVPAAVAAGKPVPVALRLANVSERALELHLVGREIAFNIVVEREGGGVVWRRLAHTPIQGILQIKMLAPGEVLELRDTWRQHDDRGRAVPAGIYTVRGEVPTEDPRNPLRTGAARLRIR